MLPAVTYDTYTDLYGGTKLSEDQFDASIHSAVSAVKELIWPNQCQDEEDEAAYAMAVCAAAEVDCAHGASGGVGGGYGSMRIGSFSASGGGGSGAASYHADMRSAVERELVGTGLLYAGLG